MPNIHAQPCTDHLYTIAVLCIFLLKPAHLLAPPEDIDMHHTYEEAYAAHYPQFQKAYKSAPLQACLGARKDIYETLVHHYGRTPYEGKLMAELDAARERIMVLSRSAAA